VEYAGVSSLIARPFCILLGNRNRAGSERRCWRRGRNLWRNETSFRALPVLLNFPCPLDLKKEEVRKQTKWV